MKNHKDTANRMIREDLRNAGFETAENMNGDTRVSLNRSNLSTMEVTTALYQAGYEASQFKTSRMQDYVIVEAIVG